MTMLKRHYIRLLFLAFFFSLAPFLLIAKQNVAQTFFMPRSIVHSAYLERVLSTYQLAHGNYDTSLSYLQDKKLSVNLSVMGLHRQSTHANDLARYFLMRPQAETTSLQTIFTSAHDELAKTDCTDHCDKPLVATDACPSSVLCKAPSGCPEIVVDELGAGDIGSAWLLLDGVESDPFKGSFIIQPRRTVSGVTFSYHYDLSCLLDKMWVEAFAPFVHIEHEMRLAENRQTQTVESRGFSTISAALASPSWRYGKWSPRTLSLTGFDDILVKLGYGIVCDPRVRIDLCGELTIPVGSTPGSEFVFEPVLGNGGHVGLGLGCKSMVDVIATSQHTLSIASDLRYRYLFSATQKRSLDLVDRPWSRYLVINGLDQQENPLPFDLFAAPAINILTQEVRVTPGSSVNLLGLLHYRYALFNLECGYDFWWRTQESIKLSNPFTRAVGITAQGTNLWLPNAKIADQWSTTGDGTFTRITQSDINLKSAAHKSAMTHTLFGATSISGYWYDHPVQIGGGASYEYATSNAALCQWTLFVQAQLGF